MNRCLSWFCDALFPKLCIRCGWEGAWVCQDCASAVFGAEAADSCPVCARAGAGGYPCDPCAPKSFLTAHRAVFSYAQDALLARLLHSYKYRYITSVEEVFAAPVRAWWEARGMRFKPWDAVVPVPLHPRRFAERGFNQAEQLAEIVASISGLPVLPLLSRIAYTKPQAHLKREQRLRNVAQAFRCRPNPPITGRHLLLIDDVFTTGATMQACASALRDAGAASVFGWTLARG